MVSWPSLETGGALVMRIPETMSSSWQEVPLYAERFGQWYFFVGHPAITAAPPLTDPEISGDDASMITTLRASLATMNQQVDANVIRARNTPAPLPPDPGSKKFWRIKADWDLDSDDDGSPDWCEFKLAAAQVGDPALRADAFDADTDGNGEPDGQQLDYDGDGASDALDGSPGDAFYSIPIGPVPRYAAFGISGAVPAWDIPRPLQINDRGTVLYSNGVWMGGVWTPLSVSGPGVNNAIARAINDSNVILGSGEVFVSGGAEGTQGRWFSPLMCQWPSPGSAPVSISAESGSDVLYPSPPEGFAAGITAPGTVLANDGLFGAEAVVFDGLNWNNEGFYKWTLGSGSIPDAAAVSGEFMYIRSDDFVWGSSFGDWSQGSVEIPGQLPYLPFVPTNVIRLPKGEILAMSGNRNVPSMVWRAGAWNASSVFASALDASDNGVAIGHQQDSAAAPLLFNGNWTRFADAVPHLPLTWNTTNTQLHDTTPNGWILASTRSSSATADQYAALLPIILEGVDPDRDPTDSTPYLEGGVDRVSTAARNGSARTREAWVMAPIGGAFNTIRVFAPVTPQSSLRFQDGPGVAFPDGAVTASGQTLTVHGTGTATAECKPAACLGGNLDSLNFPVGFYAMKRRTVKVAIHWVVGKDATGAQVEPGRFPDDAEWAEEELNRVYGRQTNTFFDATVIREDGPDHGGIQFDTQPPNPHNGEIVADPSSPELTLALVNPLARGQAPAANIDVWVIPGVILLNPGGSRIYGRNLRNEPGPSVVIDGSLLSFPLAGSDCENFLAHVMAHEIGHVLMGTGHADTGDCEAPLFWKSALPTPARPSSDPRDHARLMCSGGGASFLKPGQQLIKREWELIEAWLKQQEDDKRL